MLGSEARPVAAAVFVGALVAVVVCASVAKDAMPVAGVLVAAGAAGAGGVAVGRPNCLAMMLSNVSFGKL